MLISGVVGKLFGEESGDVPASLEFQFDSGAGRGVADRGRRRVEQDGGRTLAVRED